ncbi:MAG: rhodanese-like domain-containing protein [Candidatus Electrothrix sp. MAN1_4]|nr:rhodanese-like domain-containing protein [Candidatus Electrothrix sp. MAN1_4]
MNKNIIMFLCCLLLSTTSLCAAEDVQIMNAEELKKELNAQDISILDVRSERGWSKSDVKIPGALRVTWDNFKEWSESIPEENKKENRFVLYCS